MPRFAANLTMLFNEVSFLERFQQAADAGFNAVEFLFPYAFDINEIKQKMVENHLDVVLFNMPPGNWAAGDRGMAAIPERQKEFRDSVTIALSYAKELSCKRVHALAGLICENADLNEMKSCYVENLRFAADKCAEQGVAILIEPLNNQDVPAYFLQNTDQARNIIELVARPNIGLQLDFYHLQVTEGDLDTKFHSLADIIHHVQIAGVPGRHEPDVGEINYSHIFKMLDQNGYRGWVGCEYKPTNRTKDGLAWFDTYKQGAR